MSGAGSAHQPWLLVEDNGGCGGSGVTLGGLYRRKKK
jgi:hypothetical protein